MINARGKEWAVYEDKGNGERVLHGVYHSYVAASAKMMKCHRKLKDLGPLFRGNRKTAEAAGLSVRRYKDSPVRVTGWLEKQNTRLMRENAELRGAMQEMVDALAGCHITHPRKINKTRLLHAWEQCRDLIHTEQARPNNERT